jgi:glycosyltransferase involved in cell wall biosynthesis
MPPLVSVIMAVHNGDAFVGAAVESILSQTFRDFEFIIFDDASTDSTPSLLAEYARRDTRLCVRRLEQNLGLTICLNQGIEMAQGKFIARMDADDVCLPQRLEKQLEFMQAHPEVDVLGTGFVLMDRGGRQIKEIAFSPRSEILKWNLPFFTPIAHPTVMMRTESIKRLGGYDPQKKRAQDYDLWWRVSFSGRLANLTDIHLLLRQHPDNISAKYHDQQEDFSRAIGAKYLSLALQRSISEDLVEHIRGKRTTAQMAALAAETILDYACLCLLAAPPDVAVEIVKDAWVKSARKIARFSASSVTWRTALRLLSFPFFMRVVTVKKRPTSAHKGN